jgi:2-hydroxychromene-2-carboxylate isomerase
MSATIDFWVDFSSPYSYVANAWVDALARRHGDVPGSGVSPTTA